MEWTEHPPTATYTTPSGTTGTVPAPWHDRLIAAARADDSAAFDATMAEATDALAADGIDVARFTVAPAGVVHGDGGTLDLVGVGRGHLTVDGQPMDAPTTVLDVTQLADATGSVDPGVQPDLAALVAPTSAGLWDHRYADADPDHPAHYIDTRTYADGVRWLGDARDPGETVVTVEDWGCGLGWFAHTARAMEAPLAVVGIDGSHSPFADRVEDLGATDYWADPDRLRAPCAFMRAVAEHNHDPGRVLWNFARAFSRRGYVAFFTPMATDSDVPVALAAEAPGYPGVPDMSLPAPWVEAIWAEAGLDWTTEQLTSDTAYGVETVYRLWRPGHGPAS